MATALEGLKVIEMGTHGPAGDASGWLGDMGADVVMVESPTNKAQPLPWREGGAARAVHSRNKRSIVLDLRAEEARTVLHKLAKESDVLIEANRPGVAKRLGFDYATLEAINPRIIVCSSTGYGQEGPYKMLPGHGLVWEATGGWLRTQGQGYGNMGGDYTGRPWVNYFNLADMKGASNVLAVILMALYVREKTGVGQHLDMALFDGVIAVREQGTPSRGDGTFEAKRLSTNVYECKDGKYIATAAGEQLQWANLCEGLGVPELAKEHDATGQRAQEIAETFQRVFKTRTRDEWFAHLTHWDTEVAKVNSIDEAAQNPQVKLRGMHVEVVGDNGHREIQYGTPFKLSKTPGRSSYRRAPKFGENTDQVLSSLGYNKAEIARLHQSKVVA